MINLKQIILDATNGGLDAICHYYPQAREIAAGNTRKKHFKMRDEEKTASASIKCIQNIWYVTDFGDDSRAKNCFDICMDEEHIPFSQALHLLAERHNCNWTLSPTVNKSRISSRKANDGEKNGDFSFIKREPTEADLRALGPFVTPTVMDDYNYSALESYSITKDGKTSTYKSSDDFPIYMYSDTVDGKEFHKIYKPYEYDKAFRFFVRGERPKDYINGFAQVKDQFAKQAATSDEEGQPKKKKKLPEVIICSGERDSLNVAGMGYMPIWFNSESADIPHKVMSELLRMADKVYIIPDIDDGGIAMGHAHAQKHWDLHTVTLPMWLRTYKDNRGRQRKDLRDFLELRPSLNEFRSLLRIAPKATFWRREISDKGERYSINATSLLQFLKIFGFYKFTDPSSNDIRFVRKHSYIVEEQNHVQIRDFVKNTMRERGVDLIIQETFIKSKITGPSLMSDLDTIELNFTKSTNDTSTFFFQNCMATVSRDNIEIKNLANVKKETTTYCWRKSIIKHNFKRLSPSFKVDGDIDDGLVLEILHTKSHYMRMLINASRTYWREEYENRTDPIKENNQQYILDNKFNIYGPRLHTIEHQEQAHQLLNKIYAIGYLMHRYKVRSKAYALWIMENALLEDNQTSGGSGKSLMIEALKLLGLHNVVTLEGRNKKLTDNKHITERITSEVDLLNIDDAAKDFNFNFFLSMITNGITINPKAKTSFELRYEDSPTLIFTSNYSPPKYKEEGSTKRRILFVVFSDYYHQESERDSETRKVADDFGYDLFSHSYTEDMYNEDINFCIDCLQFYLSTLDGANKIDRIDPPLDKVNHRINIATMGVKFKDWADDFFAPESENLDILISKEDMLKAYRTHSNDYLTQSSSFKKKLQAFVENSAHISTYNPRELQGSDKRIMKKISGKTTECIYLQTYNTPINYTYKSDIPYTIKD